MPIDFPNSPTTNQTFSSGGVTWRYDGTKWGVDAVSGPSYVTSLPASPVDGQEVYYAADATNGVIWHLRYRSGSSSSYKWEFAGGRGLSTQIIATSTASSLTGASWGDIASTAIKVTVPLAGDYFVEGSSTVSRDGASGDQNLTLGIKQGTTEGVLANRSTLRAGWQHFIAANGLLTGVSASTDIALRYNPATTANHTREGASLVVTPIRVG